MIADRRDRRWPRRSLARPDPAREPRPAPRDRGLPGPRLLPARARRRWPTGSPTSRCTGSTSRAGAVLEKGCVYVVPLVEGLALPAGRLRGRQRQELDRPARPLHPADHRPRRRVRPHRRRLRGPALRRDLAALLLGAGPAGDAAEPDPLPPRLGGARRRGAGARSTPRERLVDGEAHIAGGLGFSVDLRPAQGGIVG